MGQAPKKARRTADDRVPVFLVDSGTRSYGFVENLRDAFARQEKPSGDGGVFWKDVFVVRPVAWARMGQSFALHALAIALVIVITKLTVQPTRMIATQTPITPEVIYYSPSEYLTPMSTESPRAQRTVKGDPVASNQHILSVPKEADNRSQTIVTPSPLKITRDVPMPNVVAWNEKPAIPIAPPKQAPAKVIPPAPQVKSDLRKNPVALTQNAVAPAPDVKALSPAHAMLQAPTVAPPAPDLKAATGRRLSDVNLNPTAVNAAPKLPTELQRTAGGQAAPSLGSGGAVAVAPAPTMSQIGGGSGRGSGQLIALGIHPTVSGPVSAPEGNRRGTFEASPNGRAGASGTPNIVGDASGTGDGAGTKGRNGLPAGLVVGPNAGPVSASSSSQPGSGVGNGNGGTGSGTGKGSGNGSNGPGQKDTAAGNLLAKITPPSRVTTLPPRETGTGPEVAPAELAKRVFGDRKIYTMVVNVPNLNSAGGSWQVRFAQMKGAEAVPGELTAPEPLREVDPAYPTQLMRQNVEGTVVLYAIIQSDGTVSKVQILRSVDDRLDQYAAEALAKWTFHPAKKNGATVPLEAVVMVPFKAMRQPRTF